MLSNASQPHGVERARGCIPCRLEDPCFVAPSPQLRERLEKEAAKARGKGGLLAGITALAPQPRALGFDDGVIIPPDEFSARHAACAHPRRGRRAGSAARRRARRRRAGRLLRQGDDGRRRRTSRISSSRPACSRTAACASTTRRSPAGSSTSTATVVGPLRHAARPSPGTPTPTSAIRQPTGDAAGARSWRTTPRTAADPFVDFKPYDNDGNGYVDAFVVVHAGAGGEETGKHGDIWSHKWTLPAARTTPTAPRSTPT